MRTGRIGGAYGSFLECPCIQAARSRARRRGKEAQMKRRTFLASGAVVFALSVALAIFGGGGSARADNGQAIYLGMQCVNGTGINCETSGTMVRNTNFSPLCNLDLNEGLM